MEKVGAIAQEPMHITLRISTNKITGLYGIDVTYDQFAMKCSSGDTHLETLLKRIILKPDRSALMIHSKARIIQRWRRKRAKERFESHSSAAYKPWFENMHRKYLLVALCK